MTDELLAATELGLIEDVAVVALGCGAVELPPPPHPSRESKRLDNSSLFVRVMVILFIVVNHLRLRVATAQDFFWPQSLADAVRQRVMLALNRLSIGKKLQFF